MTDAPLQGILDEIAADPISPDLRERLAAAASLAAAVIELERLN